MLSPLLALVLVSCTGKDDSGDDLQPTVELSDCDPIAPTLCGLPFPSTFYMREDSTSATGWRVHLGETYREYRDRSVDFIAARNSRIDRWSKEHLPSGSES